MCGIAGILNAHGWASGRADAVLLGKSLGHRGRSGRGSYDDDRIWLHCARHAVIAPAEAKQPIIDSTGGFVLVGNGEVLNYRELTTRVSSSRRCRLRPGDLQVALELFATNNAAALEELRGPFALAVWDRMRARLTIARDRLGERPLYYYDDGDEFVFASEVRCLEAALHGRLTYDDASIASFIGLGRLMGDDRTMYREIKALPAGAILQLDVLERTRVWKRLSPVSRLRDGFPAPPCDDEVMGLLDQASSRALVADCPVAVAFSGGIDSSVALKAAIERSPDAVAITMFSAAAPEADENLRRSRAVADRLGVSVLEMPFALPSFEALLDILQTTLDQPCAEPLVMHNDGLHSAASAHAKVLVGGHGADEVFGGYTRYPALLADAGRSSTREWMAASAWERWNRTARWPESIDALLSEQFATAVDLQDDGVVRPTPYEFAEQTDPVLFGQALDLFQLMTYDNFRATDENGIFHGVEVRSPFFDIDLIACALARPLDQRITPGNPKRLLKLVFAGTPLEHSFDARKVGFDDYFPYPDWIASNWTHFSDVIAGGPLVKLGILRSGVQRRLTQLDWRSQWRLFALSTWMTRY